MIFIRRLFLALRQAISPLHSVRYRSSRRTVVVKVAMIGAGSVVFSKNLTGDILGYPEFRDATI